MNRVLVAAFLTISVHLMAHGQRANVPDFSAFPVRVERVSARSIDFRNSPGARAFRTRLKAALRNGVNFAGRYILTGWGCGTGCVYAAIIDARTGRAYFPRPLSGLATGYNDDDGYANQPIEFRKTSRLLVINGVPGDKTYQVEGFPQGRYFYEWRNNKLEAIKSIVRATENNDR